MELNDNINKKRTVRFKSVSTNNNNRLLQLERTNSNSNYSSVSKKTGAFEENLNILSGKMNSFSTKISPNNLCFSIQNNVNIRSSLDLSLKDLKDKADINNICTNINISIDNPNFSINNIENKTSSIKGSSITNRINKNKESNTNVPNNTLISFKGSDIDSESKKKDNNKIISSIYADYLENKSNSEIISDNYKEGEKINLFNDHLTKNKILKYEYSEGCIAGFSAYTYQNEEFINNNKLCINMNINKVVLNEENITNDNDEQIKIKNHLINFFSLFCGDKKDESDDLTKFLKNNFKDILLEDKEIITNTTNAIKNSFIKCEIKYITYFLKEMQKNTIKDISKIKNCSAIIILNIDDIFYIGNIGNIISLLSSNFSRKIEYLSKEDISQEKFQHNIEKKRKSLNSLLNCNKSFFNDLDNSGISFNNSKLNINNQENNKKNIINIINLNNINTYNFIRYFPGKKLSDILLYINKNILKNQTNNQYDDNDLNIKGNNKRTSSIKINNFIKDNEINKNIKNCQDLKFRRASLGPFFKISPKNINYNPTNNYRNSCAVNNINNKSQVVKIISSYPDIISFKFKKNKHDFIFVGNKIIFDKLSCDKICKIIYDTMKKCIKKHRSFELFLGCVIKDIIKKCINEGIKNSISCLFICFDSIRQLYLNQDLEEIKNIIVPLCLTYANENNYEFYDDLLSHDFIDFDKANNYYDIIDNEINNIIKFNGQLIEIYDTNDIDKEKIDINKNNTNENDNNKESKKNSKKNKCCCFC